MAWILIMDNSTITIITYEMNEYISRKWPSLFSESYAELHFQTLFAKFIYQQ